jgi:hypothetical protein
MSIQTWQETLITAQTAGPTLTTFTTAASILPTGAVYTFPSNYFYVGRLLKVKAWGQMSSFTSGTFTFNYGLGTLASPISVWTPGAITTIISLTNITWELELDMLCRSIGSGATSTIIGIGRMTSGILTGSAAGGVTNAMSWLLPSSAPAVGTGFDSTITNVGNLFCACSVSNAANAITLLGYSLSAMN